MFGSISASLQLIFVAVFMAASVCAPVRAGSLDDFESSATKKESGFQSDDAPKKKEKKSRGREDEDEADSYYARVFTELFLTGLVIGLKGSSDRIYPEGAEYGTVAREAGEQTLPFVRMDANYFYGGKDLYALDGRVEGGFGPIGADYRSTFFFERNPSDRMTLERYHFLLRTTYGERSGLDLGLGGVRLYGNSTASGFSFTAPLHINPTPSLGLVFRPAFGWIVGNPVVDYELSVEYALKFISVRGGYRWFITGKNSLKGPYAGLAAHF